jgi:hypothetical protein
MTFRILAEAVDLTDMTFDRQLLIFGQLLCREPGPALTPEHVHCRECRDQVRVQDRLHNVLQTRPLANDLITSRHLATERLGILIRNPDLRQEAAGVKLR